VLLNLRAFKVLSYIRAPIMINLVTSNRFVMNLKEEYTKISIQISETNQLLWRRYFYQLIDLNMNNSLC